jgi:hypothetical protein
MWVKKNVACVLELPKEKGGYLLLAEYYPEGKEQAITSRRYLKVGDSKEEQYAFFDMKPIAE